MRATTRWRAGPTGGWSRVAGCTRSSCRWHLRRRSPAVPAAPRARPGTGWTSSCPRPSRRNCACAATTIRQNCHSAAPICCAV
ncbi:MAG: hypothetical protein ACK56F_09150, partial [bacterium]